MNLKERIQAGIDGKFEGLNNGFSRLNDYIFGIQRATYYLLGGSSGSYKTTITDYMLLSAIKDAENKNIKLDVFYYSYEIDKLTKQANWLSVIIYQKYKIIISPEKIKGLGNNRLNKDEQLLVDNEIEEVENLFNKINFKFVSTNPTGIYNELWKHAEINGEILYENYIDNDTSKKRVCGYKPKNEESYTIVVLDHLYHLKKEREFSTKEVIDKYSEYCVALRNLFKFTFINIQQFNRSLSAIDRQKFKGIDISPQESDFKETGNTYQDCDIAIGLMSPFKMDIDTCLNYDIKKLRESMLMLKVIKNRLSKDNIAVGIYANPKAGSFAELPKPDKINYNNYV